MVSWYWTHSNIFMLGLFYHLTYIMYIYTYKENQIFTEIEINDMTNSIINNGDIQANLEKKQRLCRMNKIN